MTKNPKNLLDDEFDEKRKFAKKMQKANEAKGIIIRLKQVNRQKRTMTKNRKKRRPAFCQFCPKKTKNRRMTNPMKIPKMTKSEHIQI